MSGFQYKDYLLYPVQQAYISDCGKYYIANAEAIKDDITYEFRMTWCIKEDRDLNDVTDESEACNWDEFEVQELGVKL